MDNVTFSILCLSILGIGFLTAAVLAWYNEKPSDISEIDMSKVNWEYYRNDDNSPAAVGYIC